MADEARSLKAYGELPDSSERTASAVVAKLSVSGCRVTDCAICWLDLYQHLCVMAAVRVNETDTFADEDGANDEYFDFEDISGKEAGS